MKKDKKKPETKPTASFVDKFIVLFFKANKLSLLLTKFLFHENVHVLYCLVFLLTVCMFWSWRQSNFSHEFSLEKEENRCTHTQTWAHTPHTRMHMHHLPPPHTHTHTCTDTHTEEEKEKHQRKRQASHQYRHSVGVLQVVDGGHDGHGGRKTSRKFDGVVRGRRGLMNDSCHFAHVAGQCQSGRSQLFAEVTENLRQHL